MTQIRLRKVTKFYERAQAVFQWLSKGESKPMAALLQIRVVGSLYLVSQALPPVSFQVTNTFPSIQICFPTRLRVSTV